MTKMHKSICRGSIILHGLRILCWFSDWRSKGNKRDAKKLHMYANESHGVFGIFSYSMIFLLFSSLMFCLEMLRQNFQVMFLIRGGSFYTHNYSNPHPKTYKPRANDASSCHERQWLFLGVFANFC